jgi:hypothetical protein
MTSLGIWAAAASVSFGIVAKEILLENWAY